MIRSILRNIAKVRMRQEGIDVHKQCIQPRRNGDTSLFAENWRNYAKKGVKKENRK